MSKTIAFQGVLGAYSHLACRDRFPQHEPLPCEDFVEALAAVREGRADLGMIPIDNSTAGRVADIHHLLPESGLQIIGEHFQPVLHNLLARPGSDLAKIKTAHCHIHTVGQVRNFLADKGIKAVVASDNAGAAAWVASEGDETTAAIASSLAGELYDLETVAGNINDAKGNTTRFVVLSKTAAIPEQNGEKTLTSLVFRTHSVPASLFKALCGFATYGVNITKLESYITDASFEVAQFYLDIEGHVESPAVAGALEELSYYSKDVKILGSYPASPFRAFS